MANLATWDNLADNKSNNQKLKKWKNWEDF